MPQTKVRKNYYPKEFSLLALSDDLWRHRLKIGVLPCLNVLFWLRDVPSVILFRLQHRRIGGEFSFCCLMNERFRCILKHRRKRQVNIFIHFPQVKSTLSMYKQKWRYRKKKKKKEGSTSSRRFRGNQIRIQIMQYTNQSSAKFVWRHFTTR